jgi:hypothetical protein
MSIRKLVKFCSITIALIALTIPIAATSQDCIDYTQYLHWLNCGQDVSSLGLTLVGDLVYVSATDQGLIIYDVSDPSDPVRLGSVVTPGVCAGNIVLGDLAYVADYWSPGFCVVDVANPLAPEVIGSTGTGTGWYYDLAMVAPDTVWVTDALYGIVIIEVSDPTNPTMVGGFPASGTWSIESSNGYAYLVDTAGLKVYDLSEGADTGDQVGFVSIPGNNYGLVREGDLFYVTGATEMTIVDVGDPENPMIVGSYPTQGPGVRMQIDGGLGFIAEDNIAYDDIPGLEIVDLSIPTYPVHLNRLTTGEACQDVFLAKSIAFMTSSNRGLFVADITNLATAPHLGVLDLPVAQQVVVAGDYAYVPSQSFGLQIVDISMPTVPDVVGIYDSASYPVDVALQGDRAYLAAGILEIIDISDPATPTFVGSANPFGSVNDVAVQGDWVYLAAQDRGLQVIDISVETTPVERATLTTPDWLHGLTVRGDYLYMACDLEGLQVADVSNPLTPTMAGSLALPGPVVDVTLFGDLAFISGSEHGLHIVDVSTPTAPTLVATLGTPGTVWDAAVDSNLVYLADVFGGMQIADISDPAQPFLVGSLETSTHNAYGIALGENCVCIADLFGGLVTAPRQCEGVSSVPHIPEAQLLSLQANPNPFNPRTRLVFEVPGSTTVDLMVYDVAGRLVRVLLENFHVDGRIGTVDWNGRDDAGRLMAAGVYVCRLESGGHLATTSVVLVK